MAQYEITAPNGQTYRIEGPEGATDEQVQAEVLRQYPDAAGSGAADPYAEDPTNPGMTNDGSLIGTVTDDAPFGLDTLATSAKAVGGNLLQGAAAIPDLMAQGGEMVSNGIGSVLGAGVAAMLRAHGASQQTLDDWAAIMAPHHSTPLGKRFEEMTPQAMPGVETAAQLAGGFAVPIGGAPVAAGAKFPTASAKAVSSAAGDIVQAGEREGVRVMTSDVRPPQTFIGRNTQSLGEKIPFAGTGGPRAKQQAERVEAVKTVLRDFGGDDAQHYLDSGSGVLEDIAKNLTAQRSGEISRLTTVKNGVIDGLQGVVPTPNANKAIDDEIARLTGLKNASVNPVIEQLKNWKLALQGQTLRNIEDNRKIIGESFNDPGLAAIKTVGQSALNKIYAPLREDMGNFIRAEGGGAARARWAKANERLSVMAGELKNAKLRNVLQTSEMTPENVGKLLFSGNRSDVQRLVSGLDGAGKARAQAAVLQRAFDKAVSPDGGLSVERFVGNMKRMGEPIGVVFEGADKLRLDGLARLLDATRRASAASVAPPTGAQNTPLIAGYSLGALFGSAALPITGAAGLLARAYEGRAVRNALIGISKAPKGSRQEAIAMDRAVTALTAVANDNKQALGQSAEQAFSATPNRAAAEEQDGQ